MESIQLNTKTDERTSFQSPQKLKFATYTKRFLFLMAAIIAAMMTFTACLEDDNEGGENGNEGGVSGKRIKSWVQETSRPQDYVRVEYTYNSDGSIKQADHYDASGHFTRNVYTNNSNGTTKKIDQTFIRNTSIKGESVFSYTNNTLQLMAVTVYLNGVATETTTTEYTFANGRKTREFYTGSGGAVTIERKFEYDSNGKRTITTETQTMPILGTLTRTFTRSYNADGTLKTVTFPWGPTDPTPVTMTVTWENGKKAVDEDIYLAL